MKFTLISPRLALQKGDFLGSGVPYWPLELAVLAAFLRNRGEDVSVIDLFGSNPRELEDAGDYFLQGKSLTDSLPSHPGKDAEVFGLYALSYMSHAELQEMAKEVRRLRPDATIFVLENSQAVTAYAIDHVAQDFFDAGVDALICGEPYANWEEIQTFLSAPKNTPPPANVMSKHHTRTTSVQRKTELGGSYPVPAWDLFPVANYWKLPYSHGPKTKRYLPILTSRGCPYPCDFCIVPETNNRRWRPRSAEEVVAEMATLKKQFGVSDFQLEDLNPTVNSKRMDEICNLLIEQKLEVRFFIASGTKAETVKIEQVPLYARAGCRYLSISPESGSPAIMKAIGKPFDYAHGKKLVEACRKNGIATQACFIVGHPQETEADHQLSMAYLKELLQNGLDEAAIFIIAPFAGSQLFQQGKIKLSGDKNLISFSPKGRADWETVQGRRSELVRLFFKEKLKRGLDLWAQGGRAVLGTPRTKMENLPRRLVFVYGLLLKSRIKRLVHG